MLDLFDTLFPTLVEVTAVADPVPADPTPGPPAPPGPPTLLAVIDAAFAVLETIFAARPVIQAVLMIAHDVLDRALATRQFRTRTFAAVAGAPLDPADPAAVRGAIDAAFDEAEAELAGEPVRRWFVRFARRRVDEQVVREVTARAVASLPPAA